MKYLTLHNKKPKYKQVYLFGDLFLSNEVVELFGEGYVYQEINSETPFSFVADLEQAEEYIIFYSAQELVKFKKYFKNYIDCSIPTKAEIITWLNKKFNVSEELSESILSAVGTNPIKIQNFLKVLYFYSSGKYPTKEIISELALDQNYLLQELFFKVIQGQRRKSLFLLSKITNFCGVLDFFHSKAILLVRIKYYYANNKLTEFLTNNLLQKDYFLLSLIEFSKSYRCFLMV